MRYKIVEELGCVACGLCSEMCPEFFKDLKAKHCLKGVRMDNGWISRNFIPGDVSLETIQSLVGLCPVSIIHLEEVKEEDGADE